MKLQWRGKFFFVALFLLVNVLPVQANPENIGLQLGGQLRFEHLTVEDGLPHSTVLSVLQDQQGFMWFATADGLSRYDGTEFTNFQNDKDDPNSLSNNNTFSLIESHDGLIWIGTDPGGLNVYDPSTGKFTVYRHYSEAQKSLADDSVWSLLEDKDGRIWVGTRNGISRLDRETGSFTNYLPDENNPRSLAAPVVFRIYEDRAGTIWIGTNNGLQRYDPDTDDFTTFLHSDDDPSSISSSNIWAMLEDSQGNFWVGTRRNGGLNLFDRENETFIAYQHSTYDGKSISDDNIWYIYEDSSGNLWVLTADGGLNLFDVEKKTFKSFQHNPHDPSTLSNNDIFWMTEDASGVLWITSRYGGVNKLYSGLSQFGLYRGIPENSNTLSSNEIYSVLAEENGTVWIGTFGGGLNRFDRKTGRMTVYLNDPEDPTSISKDKIYYIQPGNIGGLWLATYGGGLNYMNTATQKFTVYTDTPETPYGLGIKYPTTIESAEDGKLWVGTLGFGMFLFNPETGEIEKEYEADAGNPDSMAEGTVYDLVVDPSHKVWVATARGGLELLDPQTDRFTNYLNDPDDDNSILSNTVHALYFDETHNIIWAGTAGGLSGLDITTGRWYNYAKSDGLPSDTITGIQPGDGNDLWVSTTKGISRFERDIETFFNYFSQDGLQGDQFQIACSHLGPDGEIFFGGSNGLTFFQPEDLTTNPYLPPVVFTEFFLFNQTVSAGSEFLPQPIEKTEKITLPYDQNVFGIRFAALSYQLSAKNLYQYKLEGFEDEWSPPSTSHGARYTNLSPGSYTFMVRAANNDGVWNEMPAELVIEIQPPWWGTWWFRILTTLIAALLLFGIIQLRIKSIRTTNKELEQRVNGRTKELQDAKDDLHQVNDELKKRLDEVTALQEKVREQAIRDALTGLYNRHYLSEMLESELIRAKRNKHPIIFMLMDLDRFKNINDTYGHQAGDEALVSVAKTISAQIRGSDIACRYGGEEFMIIMPEIELGLALIRAEQFRDMIKALRIPFKEHLIQVTMSIGVASYPDHGQTSDEMLSLADNALYKAKAEGRNKVVVCTPDLC